MVWKIIAVSVLCIIILVQYIFGIRKSIKQKAGCLGILMFTAYAAFLLAMYYLAGVFNF